MATAEEIRAAKLGRFDWTDRIVNLDQLLSKPPTPIRYPVSPLVARGFVTTLAGAADVGKSLTAMALAIAGGQHRAYIAGMSVNGGTCALLDGENGAMLMHHRLWEAAAKATDLVLVNTLGLHVVEHQAHFKQLLSDQAGRLGDPRQPAPAHARHGRERQRRHDRRVQRARRARPRPRGRAARDPPFQPEVDPRYRGSTAIRDQTDSVVRARARQGRPGPQAAAAYRR